MAGSSRPPWVVAVAIVVVGLLGYAVVRAVLGALGWALRTAFLLALVALVAFAAARLGSRRR